MHAASLLALQLWAFSGLRDVIPPLGEQLRKARLLFLGVVAALAVALVLSFPLGAFVRYEIWRVWWSNDGRRPGGNLSLL